jgi:hypothetical protein
MSKITVQVSKTDKTPVGRSLQSFMSMQRLTEILKRECDLHDWEYIRGFEIDEFGITVGIGHDTTKYPKAKRKA